MNKINKFINNNKYNSNSNNNKILSSKITKI